MTELEQLKAENLQMREALFGVLNDHGDTCNPHSSFDEHGWVKIPNGSQPKAG